MGLALIARADLNLFTYDHIAYAGPVVTFTDEALAVNPPPLVDKRHDSFWRFTGSPAALAAVITFPYSLYPKLAAVRAVVGAEFDFTPTVNLFSVHGHNFGAGVGFELQRWTGSAWAFVGIKVPGTLEKTATFLYAPSAASKQYRIIFFGDNGGVTLQAAEMFLGDVPALKTNPLLPLDVAHMIDTGGALPHPTQHTTILRRQGEFHFNGNAADLEDAKEKVFRENARGYYQNDSAQRLFNDERLPFVFVPDTDDTLVIHGMLGISFRESQDRPFIYDWSFSITELPFHSPRIV